VSNRFVTEYGEARFCFLKKKEDILQGRVRKFDKKCTKKLFDRS